MFISGGDSAFRKKNNPLSVARNALPRIRTRVHMYARTRGNITRALCNTRRELCTYEGGRRTARTARKRAEMHVQAGTEIAITSQTVFANTPDCNWRFATRHPPVYICALYLARVLSRSGVIARQDPLEERRLYIYDC